MSSDRPYRPAAAFQRVLDDLERMGNPLDQMTAESIGDLWLLREALSCKVLQTLPLGGMRDVCVPARNRQIPVRIYTPAAPQRDGRPPVLVYYHGGGWSLGSLNTYDSICRKLAGAIPALVVSVDYRLAPEHPFPAAVQDAHLALHWVARNAFDLGGDPRRLAVAGDSAGGNLAAVVALRARKEELPVILQALFYPSTDVSRTDYPSYRQYGRGHWLTTEAVEKFRSYYLPDPRDWRNPEASPMLVSDEDARRLPVTLVMTAGCDPLRDDGQAYADRLRGLGVPVDHRLEPELIHAALNLFNSALYPDASRRVEPVLDALAEAIRLRVG
jgi:acetyl esterase